jgi:hypothetical protein
LCLPTAMDLVSIVLITFATAQFPSSRVSFSSYSCPATQEVRPSACLRSNIFSCHSEVPTSFSQRFDSSQSRLHQCSVAKDATAIIARREEPGALPSMLGPRTGVGSSAPPTVH